MCFDWRWWFTLAAVVFHDGGGASRRKRVPFTMAVVIWWVGGVAGNRTIRRGEGSGSPKTGRDEGVELAGRRKEDVGEGAKMELI